MEDFSLINNNRLLHGYTTNQFNSYKKYCNKMKRVYLNHNTGLYLLYSLEANLAKFKLIGSLNYLYKNIRLLRKECNEFSELYTRYMNCFISSKKDTVDIDSLVELRSYLADFYSFLDDIYIIGDNRHDFEQYKVKYQWKDITIVFETQKILESFLDGTFLLHDFRFNTQLALKILEFEEKLKSFIDFVRGAEKQAPAVFSLANGEFTSISVLGTFLSDNFVESEYVSKAKDDCSKVLNFLKKLVEFEAGIIHNDIDAFQTPELLMCVEVELEKMKSEKHVETSKLRSILLDIIEKNIEICDKHRVMPFLPVFYDLAYDFIDYSPQNSSVAGLLQNFSFFNKK